MQVANFGAMTSTERKHHWEQLYASKKFENCSWYQPKPSFSFEQIQRWAPDLSAAIIDIGAGESYLTQQLLLKGDQNLSVLDIATTAIEKAKTNLGKVAHQVRWFSVDCTLFETENRYEIWHDRAVFHFLTDAESVQKYVTVAAKHVLPGGVAIIGTFAKSGPDRCSGIPVQQYDTQDLVHCFADHFSLLESHTQHHTTPFDTQQVFTFCIFKRKSDPYLSC